MFADFWNFESMNAVFGNETPECALAPDLECFGAEAVCCRIMLSERLRSVRWISAPHLKGASHGEEDSNS